MQSSSKRIRIFNMKGLEYYSKFPRKKEGKGDVHRYNRRTVNKHINEFFE